MNDERYTLRLLDAPWLKRMMSVQHCLSPASNAIRIPQGLEVAPPPATVAIANVTRTLNSLPVGFSVLTAEEWWRMADR